MPAMITKDILVPKTTPSGDHRPLSSAINLVKSKFHPVATVKYEGDVGDNYKFKIRTVER